jgi:tetratricopeptide (TPR) repeat protein
MHYTKHKTKQFSHISVCKISEPTVEPITVTNAVSIIDQGNEYFSKGKYDSAIECYNKALKIDPEQIKAWNNRGFAFHNLGRYDAAVVLLNSALVAVVEALRMNPDRYAVIYNSKYDDHNDNIYESSANTSSIAVLLAGGFGNRGTV